MKLIYQCNECRLIAEIENDTTAKEAVPTGWVKREHIDGEHYWICTDCAARKGVKRGAVHCSKCGKRVSNQVVEELVIRAWVECPECIEKGQNKNLQVAGEKIHSYWQERADGADLHGAGGED